MGKDVSSCRICPRRSAQSPRDSCLPSVQRCKFSGSLADRATAPDKERSHRSCLLRTLQMQASRSRTPPARDEDLKLGAVQGKKRGPKPRGSVAQLSRTPDKLNGSKESPRSAPKSSNGRARVEVARNHGNGKLRKKELTEISDEESSDAASGYYVSDSEEEEVQPTPAAYSRKVGEAGAARPLGIKTSSLKKQAVVKKAARPKASGKEAYTSDGVEDEALDEVDDMSYYVSQNGGGRDGPLNINLPGADSSNWTSSDFCLVVNNGWRRDRGERFR